MKPKKQRKPVTEQIYNDIYKKAPELDYECLKIAMAISAYTTLREGDICALRFDKHIVDGELRITVSKSEAQKGTARATRLKWVLKDHPILKSIIHRARQLAMINKACPFIISHTPKRRVWNEQKEHTCQVTGDRLSRMFNEVMKSCGIEGTCFHEVRGYASTNLKKSGYTLKQIQELMAHEDVKTTIGYQNADDLPYEEVTIKPLL